MTPFEEPTRPSKKRKIALADSSQPISTPSPSKSSPATQNPLPFSTRAFRAVKDVVLGKHADKADEAGGEDGQTTSPAATPNGAMGGLRKSLSTLELWKMARLQNGSTRGMGISKTGNSSPASSASGTRTPTTGKRKRDGIQEKLCNGKEERGDTPSKRVRKANGVGSVEKRKKVQSEIQDEVDGEEDEEDPLQGALSQTEKTSVSMNGGSPVMAIESTPKDTGFGRTPRRKRRKPPEGSAEKANGFGREDYSSSKTTPTKERPLQSSSTNEEEAALGFKAIETPKPARDGVAEIIGSNSEDIVMNSTSTSLKKRGRPPKSTANNTIDHRQPILHLDEHLDGADEQVSVRDAEASLQRALEEVSLTELTVFKSALLAVLTGKRRLPLVNLDSEYQKVHQLVEQTVLAGEGNSMLLIGSRGCAKTTLAETVISDLSIDHGKNFHVIRLNGFVHTDDKLALREIWRQLGREMEIGDDATTGQSNYADALTSLLALLSHSVQEEAEVETPSIAKSVIFILDEFDLFASHPRQTLLYNLFDVAQSRNAPIAVLGLTTKIDVVESLEKRVKSRFGQRYVHLSLPRTFTAFMSICKAALIPPSLSIAAQFKDHSANHRTGAAVQDLRTAWTTYINSLVATTPFLTHLRSIYATTKSIPTFFSSSIYPISALSASNIPTPQSFLSSSTSLRPPDSKLHLISALSELALSLLIAAARLDIILSTDLCNFEMVYEEYINLASRVKMQTSASGQLAVSGGGGRVWGRVVAKGEWERLIDLELILPATGGTIVGRGKGEQGRMWKVDVGLEEIGGSVKMGAVMARWCRQI